MHRYMYVFLNDSFVDSLCVCSIELVHIFNFLFQIDTTFLKQKSLSIA